MGNAPFQMVLGGEREEGVLMVASNPKQRRRRYKPFPLRGTVLGSKNAVAVDFWARSDTSGGDTGSR